MSVPVTNRLRDVRFAGAPAREYSSRVDAVPADRPCQRRPPQAGPLEVAASPDGFASWVLTRAGLTPEAYRAEPLARREPACVRACRADSAAAARLRIESQPDLLDHALDAFLIGVTSLFRDSGVFDGITRDVIPIFASRPGPLRIWSAGCSAGAELHSTAILLAEAGLLDRASLVGTDCRPSAIDAARLARYSESALEAVPRALRDRYFTRDGDRRQLVRTIRDRIEWRVRDVLVAAEQGPWDLVFCRNLTIYLAAHASRRVTGAAASALAPGGFLVIGRAERLPADSGLTPVARCIYRRIL